MFFRKKMGPVRYLSDVAKRAVSKSGPAKVPVNVELDQDVNEAMEEWASDEGRSKRNHLAILARKLVRLRKNKPDELHRLGLMDEK